MSGEKTTQQKRIDAMAAAFATEEEMIIRRYGLTGQELTRARTMDPDDPISLYFGRLDIQAALIAEEREARAAENGGNDAASIAAAEATAACAQLGAPDGAELSGTAAAIEPVTDCGDARL